VKCLCVGIELNKVSPYYAQQPYEFGDNVGFMCVELQFLM
jgi:hypothetical protein